MHAEAPFEGRVRPSYHDLDRLHEHARRAVAEYRALEHELPTQRIALGVYLQPAPFEWYFLHEVRALLGADYDATCEHRAELEVPTSAATILRVQRWAR